MAIGVTPQTANTVMAPLVVEHPSDMDALSLYVPSAPGTNATTGPEVEFRGEINWSAPPDVVAAGTIQGTVVIVALGA